MEDINRVHAKNQPEHVEFSQTCQSLGVDSDKNKNNNNNNNSDQILPCLTQPKWVQATSSSHKKKRTIVIGDVHGCLDELQELLYVVQYNKGSDRLVFVGDLVGKGPASVEVVEFVMRLGAECVKGNWEYNLLQNPNMLHYAAQKKLQKQQKYMQRRQTRTQFPIINSPRFLHEIDHPLPLDFARDRNCHADALLDPALKTSPTLDLFSQEQLQWIEDLPFYIYLDEHNTLVVHAGLDPSEEDFTKQKKKVLMTVRNILENGKCVSTSEGGRGHAWILEWKGPYFVIFGHDARRGLQQTPYALGIDTGCVYGQELTAYVLPDKKVYQVRAKHRYTKNTLSKGSYAKQQHQEPHQPMQLKDLMRQSADSKLISLRQLSPASASKDEHAFGTNLNTNSFTPGLQNQNQKGPSRCSAREIDVTAPTPVCDIRIGRRQAHTHAPPYSALFASSFLRSLSFSSFVRFLVARLRAYGKSVWQPRHKNRKPPNFKTAVLAIGSSPHVDYLANQKKNFANAHEMKKTDSIPLVHSIIRHEEDTVIICPKKANQFTHLERFLHLILCFICFSLLFFVSF